MRALNKMLDYGGTRAEMPQETRLLGRIGDELAALYHETLHAPLPDDLQELVELLGPDGTASESESDAP